MRTSCFLADESDLTCAGISAGHSNSKIVLLCGRCYCCCQAHEFQLNISPFPPFAIWKHLCPFVLFLHLWSEHPQTQKPRARPTSTRPIYTLSGLLIIYLTAAESGQIGSIRLAFNVICLIHFYHQSQYLPLSSESGISPPSVSRSESRG